MQITVEDLCIALQQFLLQGGNAKGSVFIEGCDCIGKAIGLHKFGSDLIIRRDNVIAPVRFELNEIITGKDEGKNV